MSDERGLCAKLLRSIRYIDARIVSLAVNEVRGAFAVVGSLGSDGQITNRKFLRRLHDLDLDHGYGG